MSQADYITFRQTCYTHKGDGGCQRVDFRGQSPDAREDMKGIYSNADGVGALPRARCADGGGFVRIF